MEWSGGGVSLLRMLTLMIGGGVGGGWVGVECDVSVLGGW